MENEESVVNRDVSKTVMCEKIAQVEEDVPGKLIERPLKRRNMNFIELFFLTMCQVCFWVFVQMFNYVFVIFEVSSKGAPPLERGGGVNFLFLK